MGCRPCHGSRLRQNSRPCARTVLAITSADVSVVAAVVFLVAVVVVVVVVDVVVIVVVNVDVTDFFGQCYRVF